MSNWPENDRHQMLYRNIMKGAYKRCSNFFLSTEPTDEWKWKRATTTFITKLRQTRSNMRLDTIQSHFRQYSLEFGTIIIFNSRDARESWHFHAADAVFWLWCVCALSHLFTWIYMLASILFHRIRSCLPNSRNFFCVLYGMAELVCVRVCGWLVIWMKNIVR